MSQSFSIFKKNIIMRFIALLFCLLIVSACKEDYSRSANITAVEIESILVDSTLSIRALDFNDEHIYYGSNKQFGRIDLEGQFKINLTEFSAKV